MSLSQKNFRKLCLNMWSWRWLKPDLSLVISFIPIGLWQVKVLFGDDCINCKMFFLKREKLSELLILLSRLFNSFTVGGKNEFLKKVCLTLNQGMFSVLFLVLYSVLVVGILSNRYLYFKEIAMFSKPPLLL